MSKKPNLAHALKSNRSEAQNVTSDVQVPSSKSTPSQTRAPSRQGQSNISGWFDNTVKFTLEELRLKRQRALGRRVTIQELMGESYNDLFKKHGFPEVAPTSSER